MHLSRRTWLQSSLAVGLGFHGLKSLLAAESPARARAGFGPLVPDPEKLLDLPDGFSYTILSRMGDPMTDGFLVPGQPDGMAAFAGKAGRVILVRNQELESKWISKSPFGKNNALLEKLPRHLAYDYGRGTKPSIGGTTTLIYDPQARKIERQFLSLVGTEYNCAGGPTPWGSWISCEESTVRAGDERERDHGYPFEVPADSEGPVTPRPLTAMGRFRREAVAVDPRTGIVYQSEDLPDGLLYRFLPDRPGRDGSRGDLAAGGKLQALRLSDRQSADTRNWFDENGKPLAPRVPTGQILTVQWVDLSEIDAPLDDLRYRGRYCSGAACFARTEGMWFGNDAVYFACTTGGKTKTGQIWRYTPSPFEGTSTEDKAPGRLELFVEPNDKTIVNNADNLTVAPWGDLVVCEDSEDTNRLIGVTPAGQTYVLARNVRDKSEFAGATFAPDGHTLFVNLQEIGLTLAITGPWQQRT